MSKLRNKVLVTGVLLHTLRIFLVSHCEIGCLNMALDEHIYSASLEPTIFLMKKDA